jgi:isopentenyl-diphosphate delta-isomerase
MEKEEVILVDEFDNELGFMEKMEAHRKGVLHRAFSVFIFNSKGEILLQKRAKSKYHCGGLWSNTCCSHPRKNESLASATTRRLNEEMGMKVDVFYTFSFIYKAELDQGLIEHEFDHVYVGYSNDIPICNPDEVEGYCYLSPEELLMGFRKHPDEYTPWLQICLKELMGYLNKSTLHEKVV